MNSKDPKNKHADEFDSTGEEEYEALELLEGLETAREVMEELGITTLAEVIQHINDLHKQLDAR